MVDLFGNGLSIKLFADDVKIYAVVDDVDDESKFQAGLDALNAWSAIWQLPISLQKCSILHLGRKNKCHSFSVDNITLPDVKCAADLGVTVDSNLRFSKHYRCMVNKAQHRASLILKTFVSREPILLFKAFTVYVLPLLEYCSPVWAPVYLADINLIERVQRRFTKRLRGLRYLSYCDRLSFLNNADTLELRRLRSDLIMMFKILHKLVDMEFCDFFGFNNYGSTRGHAFKLIKPLCVNNARQFSFACRRIDIWNSLPEYVIMSESVAVFVTVILDVEFFLNVCNFSVCSESDISS